MNKFRITFSTILIFISIISIVNIILSLVCFYVFPNLLDQFVLLRWPISFFIVLLFVLNKTILIN